MDTTAEFYHRFPGGVPLRLRMESVPTPEESEDDRLIAAAQRGDDAAFVRLVERHQEAIFRFCCRWLRQEEDAREAAQDTFVRAYLALDRYRKQGQVSTWLFQIALNQCRDRLKSRSRREARQTDSISEWENGGELSCPGISPDEAAAWSGEGERLRAAIAQLPVRLRAVVIICGIEGMSQETCAEILNISVRAVEGRFYRARAQLESMLGKEG